MVTYLYWAVVMGTAMVLLTLLGRADKWKAAAISAGVVLFLGWVAYFFYLQQIFVKHYGGMMRIAVPAGQRHIAATWKEDHLWIENYDPQKNVCYFYEYSRGNLLEGKVMITNCNPLKSTPAYSSGSREGPPAP